MHVDGGDARPDLIAKARAEGRFWEIDTGHDLMITEPKAVADALAEVATRRRGQPVLRARRGDGSRGAIGGLFGIEHVGNAGQHEDEPHCTPGAGCRIAREIDRVLPRPCLCVDPSTRARRAHAVGQRAVDASDR